KLLVSSEYLNPGERIHVWEVTTGKELWQVIDKRWSVAIAFSPDSKALFTAGYRDDDPAIIVLDAATGRQLRRIEGPAHGVFSPDGKLLASTSKDKDPTICLWDVATGKKVATLQGRGEPLWFRSFSPDGTLLATTSQDPNKLAGTGE